MALKAVSHLCSRGNASQSQCSKKCSHHQNGQHAGPTHRVLARVGRGWGAGGVRRGHTAAPAPALCAPFLLLSVPAALLPLCLGRWSSVTAQPSSRPRLGEPPWPGALPAACVVLRSDRRVPAGTVVPAALPPVPAGSAPGTRPRLRRYPSSWSARGLPLENTSACFLLQGTWTPQRRWRTPTPSCGVL